MDTKKKSIFKSFSWQISHGIIAMLFAYLISGKLYVAAAIAGVELLWEPVAYYLHERAWSKF